MKLRLPADLLDLVELVMLSNAVNVTEVTLAGKELRSVFFQLVFAHCWIM